MLRRHTLTGVDWILAGRHFQLRRCGGKKNFKRVKLALKLEEIADRAANR